MAARKSFKSLVQLQYQEGTLFKVVGDSSKLPKWFHTEHLDDAKTVYVDAWLVEKMFGKDGEYIPHVKCVTRGVLHVNQWNPEEEAEILIFGPPDYQKDVSEMISNLVDFFCKQVIQEEDYSQETETQCLPVAVREAAAQPAPVEDAEAATQVAPVENAEAATQSVKVEDGDATQLAPVKDGDATQLAPVENGDATQLTPVEHTDAATQLAPMEETDAATQVSPVEDAEAATQLAPMEDGDATQLAPVENTEAATHLAPVKEADATQLAPVEDTDAVTQLGPVEVHEEASEAVTIHTSGEVHQDVTKQSPIEV